MTCDIPDVGELVFLVEFQPERHVTEILHRVVRLGHPARHVTRVVDVSEVGGREAKLGVACVAHKTVPAEKQMAENSVN